MLDDGVLILPYIMLDVEAVEIVKDEAMPPSIPVQFLNPGQLTQVARLVQLSIVRTEKVWEGRCGRNI